MSLPTPNMPKRRRLNQTDATARLTKPFQSPMRRQPVQSSKANNRTGAESLETPLKTGSPMEDTTKGQSNTAAGNQDKTNPTNPLDEVILPPPIEESPPTLRVSKPRGMGVRISRNPEIAAAQRLRASLQRHLMELQSEVHTHRQALRIEEMDKINELHELIEKWRLAAREAAEEVFAGAKERVCRMGGVKAWKEKNEKKDEWNSGWDDGAGGNGFGNEQLWRGENGEELDEEEMERRKEMIRDEYGVEEDQAKVKEESHGETDEGNEETFTMDMMLKSLNIELGVIGFDAENQRWEDGP